MKQSWCTDLNIKNRVVVTGYGIICSLGHNKYQVLNNMKENISFVRKIERFPTEKFMSHIGGEIKEYNPSKYFCEKEISEYDLCTQYAIIAASQAIEDSGLKLDQLNPQQIGLIFGTACGGINSLEEQWTLSDLDSHRTARYPLYQQGDQIAHYFNLKGPNMTINTACAAGGNSIGFGYDMITNGYADFILAGGSDTLSSYIFSGFNALQSLNKNPCSPFGDAFGLNLGEGAGFVLLELLDSAINRDSYIYAEICGYGLSNDAYHETAPSPSGEGIKHAMELALKGSGVERDQIDYVNTHGTGTDSNDLAEINGLMGFFGEDLFPKIKFSSSKPYFGHALGGAGAIEYVSTLIALQEQLIPTTLNIENYRDGCHYPNLLINRIQEGEIEYFLSNNSGFGGHNVSILSRNFKNSLPPKSTVNFFDKEIRQRVGIVGLSAISWFGYSKDSIYNCFNLKANILGNCDFKLKDYDKSLYERRMNPLTQFSIGAVDLLLKETGWDTSNPVNQIGLIYGTSYGSLRSIEKFLEPIIEKGSEFASSLHVPDLVLSSIPGKISKKFNIRGFSSSLSTGGNDGLISICRGYDSIKNNVLNKCLIGSGDEASELSSSINRALGLDKSSFSKIEGSCFVALNTLEGAYKEGNKIFAEIKGIGLSFNGNAGWDHGRQYERAIREAIESSDLTRNQIDFVFFNSNGLASRQSKEEAIINEIFSDRKIPIYCFNDQLGYGDATSSLLHLYLAADLLQACTNIQEDWKVKKVFGELLNLKNGIAVSSSINGNNVAMVVSSVN